MRYGSICSGIEAASVAWEPLGWVPAWFSEIDPFACAVLTHHWSEVHNYGDFTTIGDAPAIDLLVGGTPCQSFSVAGLRGGLADDRGNLALEFCRLVDRLRPRWVVWENVPGVLSLDGGRAFGAIVGALGELGYGWAYRVLDAQYWGVPQRRRRVFVVGYLGDWRPPCAVLFERTSLSGHPAPRREAGQGVAAPLTASFAKHHGRTAGNNGAADSMLLEPVTYALQHAMIGRKPEAGPEGKGWRDDDIAWTLDARTGVDVVAHRLNGHHGRSDGESETFVPMVYQDSQYGVKGYDTAGAIRAGRIPEHQMVPVSVALRGRDGGATAELGDEVANALRASQGGGDKAHVLTPPVAYAISHQTTPKIGVDISPTMGINATGGYSAAVSVGMAVRRLTPRECERLQGFEDDHTLVPYRGKPAAACPDGPRYKAIGNSMAVPVVRWLGERIAMVENLGNSRASDMPLEESRLCV